MKAFDIIYKREIEHEQYYANVPGDAGAETPPSTITDYDGNVYDVIQIGSQYWTVQNWKCTHLNDGTPIPNVTDDTAWAALTTPGRCAYNNDESYV